jgi:hypothetical protein
MAGSARSGYSRDRNTLIGLSALLMGHSVLSYFLKKRDEFIMAKAIIKAATTESIHSH